MGNILCFNNKLIFLKSLTTLIVPFFLGIANVEKGGAHSEESLLQGFKCPSILQFPFSVSIGVPLT
jgi:hypothetical protein